jgi:hypothetical protein
MLIFFKPIVADATTELKLISIGLVSEDANREFFTELTGYQTSDCRDVIQESALPFLQGGSTRISMRDMSVR